MLHRFNTALARRPYCLYRVSLPPADAVQRAVDFWASRKCAITKHDMDPQLRQHGYTGVEMKGGSALKSMAKGVLEETSPLIGLLGLAKPFRRVLPDTFTIGIAASSASPRTGVSELFCLHTSDDAHDEISQPRDFTEHQMTVLGKELEREGLLVEPPRAFNETGLPEDHVLSNSSWFRMRRQAKKDRRKRG